jgi:hypothetical protein
MGSNPRRIYIYPPLQQDDGIAANRYWPPGISQLSGDQSPSTSSGYSESYPDEGGGLLGMLLRAMPQNRDQPGVDSSLASDSKPQVQFANYDSPQSGLFGRQAAPQAAQSRYQPFAESDELPLSDPRNPDFRQLARIPVAGRSRSALANQQLGDNGDAYSTGYGQPALSDVSPDPVRPGSQYAQAPFLCAAGPVGCLVGGGITLGQTIGGAAALLGGATILNQMKTPAPGSRKGGGPNGRDEEDDPAPSDDPEWFNNVMKENRRRIAAAAREHAKAVSRNKTSAGYDPGDYCSDRHKMENDNCRSRYQDYAHPGYRLGCEQRASVRRDKCSEGDLNPKGLNEWGLDDEETFHRDFLSRKPLSD